VGASTKDGARMLPGANGGVEWSPIATDPGSRSPMRSTCISHDLPRRELALSERQVVAWWCLQGDPSEAQSGNITAVNYDTGKVKWQVKTPEPMIGGILATAAASCSRVKATASSRLQFVHRQGVVEFPRRCRRQRSASSYMVGGKQYIVVGAGGNTRSISTAATTLSPSRSTERTAKRIIKRGGNGPASVKDLIGMNGCAASWIGCFLAS